MSYMPPKRSWCEGEGQRASAFHHGTPRDREDQRRSPFRSQASNARAAEPEEEEFDA
jgi:hypothetical protein